MLLIHRQDRALPQRAARGHPWRPRACVGSKGFNNRIEKERVTVLAQPDEGPHRANAIVLSQGNGRSKIEEFVVDLSLGLVNRFDAAAINKRRGGVAVGL